MGRSPGAPHLDCPDALCRWPSNEESRRVRCSRSWGRSSPVVGDHRLGPRGRCDHRVLAEAGVDHGRGVVPADATTSPSRPRRCSRRRSPRRPHRRRSSCPNAATAAPLTAADSAKVTAIGTGSHRQHIPDVTSLTGAGLGEQADPDHRRTDAAAERARNDQAPGGRGEGATRPSLQPQLAGTDLKAAASPVRPRRRWTSRHPATAPPRSSPSPRSG